MLKSYSDIISHIKKGDTKPNLLIGNGFSMAYNHEIFSHDALAKCFEDNQQASDLSLTIYNIVGSKNFEQLIRQLDVTYQIIKKISKANNEKLLKDVDKAKEALKANFIEALQKSHPEHIYKITEERRNNCGKFLSDYIEKGGSIFSTNFDLLLYWALMCGALKNKTSDGFGKQENRLIWGINQENREKQNIHYLHGSLMIFDDDAEIIKMKGQLQGNHIIDNIKGRIENSEYPVLVVSGSARDKFSQIRHNMYLNYCYEKLSSISGALVIFGFNFSENDKHIIGAINNAARNQKNMKIYIGVYSEEDKRHIDKVKDLIKNCKIDLFDSSKVTVWDC